VNLALTGSLLPSRSSTGARPYTDDVGRSVSTSEGNNETILNIGLARNDGAPDNGVLHVVAALNDYGFTLIHGEVHEVTHGLGVEQTLIAEVKYAHGSPLLPNAVHHLSVELAQDCIAIAHVNEDGVVLGGLFGPKADEWGPFNTEFFVLPKH
jgi:hypothetical protein